MNTGELDKSDEVKSPEDILIDTTNQLSPTMTSRGVSTF